jgi:hypothetical protein
MNESQGEFMPHKPRDEPMTTKGHQPGLKVSEKDSAPEFATQTLPPGSAPKDRTFQPHPDTEVPGQADNADTQQEGESTHTSASITLGGSDSREVDKGLGHPVSGMSSAERHHDGHSHRKHDRDGLEGVGSSGNKGINDPKFNPRDEDDSHGKGPIPAKEHNSNLSGAEDVVSG